MEKLISATYEVLRRTHAGTEGHTVTAQVAKNNVVLCCGNFAVVGEKKRRGYHIRTGDNSCKMYCKSLKEAEIPNEDYNNILIGLEVLQGQKGRFQFQAGDPTGETVRQY